MIDSLLVGNTLDKALEIAGALPWLGGYIAMSVACVKAVLEKAPPPRSASAAMSRSIGMTFCALWIIVAPLFLFFLFTLLGPNGFAWWGGALAAGCAGAWLWELKMPFSGSALCLLAAVMLFLGLVAGMPR